MNLVRGVKLLEMIKYEIFTCFISFSDQINLIKVKRVIIVPLIVYLQWKFPS